jgi:hypothetical protein
MDKKKGKKNIRDVEIGDFVRQLKAANGKKKCGEVVSILQDNVGDPTLECIEVHPDELSPLEYALLKQSDQNSKYTPPGKLYLRRRHSRKVM